MSRPKPDSRRPKGANAEAIVRRLTVPLGDNRKLKGAGHTWTFAARFRCHAFGWRSQPAITRVKEAVAEITTVSRRDKILAADGAVLLLERLSPALEHVDSSSGAIGSAVNRAIAMLVEIIASALPTGARKNT